MGKVVFSDLKKVSKNEKLNLKGGISKSPIKRKNITDISKQHGVCTARPGNKSKNIESIHSSKQKKDFYFVPESRFQRPNFLEKLEILKLVGLGLVIVFVINIANVVGGGIDLSRNLKASASHAYEDILAAAANAQGANFTGAADSFTAAENYFDEALQSISLLRTGQESISVKEQNIESVNHLLEAGQSISRAGKLFSQGIGNLQNIPEKFISLNQLSGETNSGESLTAGIREEYQTLRLIIAELEDAKSNLEQVNSRLIPGQIRSELDNLAVSLEKILVILYELEASIPAFLDLMGDRYPHRYLILLQNDTEARPTGGFIGSFMLVTVNDGYITKTDFHDVYDFDGQLREDIETPEDIAEITENWRMRDSNYSPDFSLSAEKAAWFLQKSKGPSVDTVIAINQSMIADLLDLTGPIQVDELQAPLNAENFQTILTYLIESKYFGERQPKVILGKVIAKFQTQLTQIEDWEELLGTLLSNIKAGKILFYSRNEDIQAIFETYGLDGAQASPAPDTDFLQVINTSIGGNKSDKYINQSLQHDTYFEKNGDIFDELTIIREHTWTDASLNSIKSTIEEFGYDEFPDYLLDILGRGENVSNVKVYVPFQSELINAIGAENVRVRHDEELQKTYFLFKMNVKPGEKSVVTLRYQLPQRLRLLPADIYKLVAQAQPGIVVSSLTKKLHLDPNLKLLKTNPELGESDRYELDLIDRFTQSVIVSN